jgi:xylose isomerase
MQHNYKFSFGPWNISDGRDVAGPAVRPVQSLGWKLEQAKQAGFDAMMMHDEDIVPEIDSLTAADIAKAAKEIKKRFDDAGMVIDLVAPRLWNDPLTIDGAFTSYDPKARRFAVERAKKAVEIAGLVGCGLVDLCLVREGTYLREAKDGRRAVELIVEAIDEMLKVNKDIRVVLEPKPNEPVDTTYIPTPGHAIALAALTQDPKRVGVLIESSHCVLAGLDPTDEFDFALAAGKLWLVHLNDQNGLKFEQDKPFGSSSLRSAFNQVRVLERNGYGSRGEFVAFEVYPFRTTKQQHVMAHLINSRKTFLRLLEKVRSFDEKRAQELIDQRDHQELDQMVIEHLLGDA